jgi:hypothetical protein
MQEYPNQPDKLIGLEQANKAINVRLGVFEESINMLSEKVKTLTNYINDTVLEKVKGLKMGSDAVLRMHKEFLEKTAKIETHFSKDSSPGWTMMKDGKIIKGHGATEIQPPSFPGKGLNLEDNADQ